MPFCCASYHESCCLSHFLSSFFGTVTLSQVLEEFDDEYYFTYSDIAMTGLPTVLDEITPEEASTLVNICC